MIRLTVFRVDTVNELHREVNEWIRCWKVPEESIINITLIAPGLWMMVYRKDTPPSGAQPPEPREESSMSGYLIIVRYDPKCNAWVVDEDSRHILEDDSKGMTSAELQVSAIRSLTQSKSPICGDEEDNDDNQKESV